MIQRSVNAPTCMSRYLPSMRGWIALMLALFASVFLPNIFPARGSSGFTAHVPTQAWVIAAGTVAVCLGASVFAAIRGGGADRVAAVIAAQFARFGAELEPGELYEYPAPSANLLPHPIRSLAVLRRPDYHARVWKDTA